MTIMLKMQTSSSLMNHFGFSLKQRIKWKRSKYTIQAYEIRFRFILDSIEITIADQNVNFMWFYSLSKPESPYHFKRHIFFP